MRVSVVIPVFNEHDNIEPLYNRLAETLTDARHQYEILFVDDGSNDGTVDRLREVAARDARVRAVLFRRNYGQTAAMHAGLQMASGDVMVTMDGDLQNDPADIGMMLDKLHEGYDLVHGWRKNRKDAWLNRKLPSVIANWIISRSTGFPIHDLGCTLKVIRREIAEELELYGEMHRFIPILAHGRGARCAEVVARHHPRQFGTTKYGIGRTFRVVLDLITIKFMLSYFASPMKLFGFMGLWCGGLAGCAGLAAVGMRVLQGAPVLSNPLLLLAVAGVLASAQFVGLGLLGEVLARVYYTHHGKANYAVRETINFEDSSMVHRASMVQRAKAA
ncbi:MAG: glycosyltransferase family 2 protein [Patescibacteria group bacterium]|nr:glycosyltransferase family 2 protein [Patescibacteria group bacterium]